MEFEISKLKSLQYKIALSIAIVRNKPENISLDHYLKLLRINFCQIHGKFSNKIYDLKLKLIEAKREIFYLKNKDSLCQSDDKISFSSRKKDIETNSDPLKLAEQYKLNLEFITNVAKLKAINKNFKFDETINHQMLKDCLSQLIGHVRVILFEFSFKDVHNLNDQSSLIVTDTLESVNQSQSFQNESSSKILFPIESILHGIQVFVNLFEVEWFYSVRSMLIDQIVSFIDELVKFIVKFNSNESCQTIRFLSQILTVLSTSDCLLNSVLFSIINNLKILIEYISDLNRFLQLNEHIETDEKISKKKELDFLCKNCVMLTECVSSIVRLRQLDYYTPINDQIKKNLNQILNNLFINLTETFPLIAIQLSKLIQLLSLFK